MQNQSVIEPINLVINVGGLPVPVQGFNLGCIIGVTPPPYFVNLLTGNSGLKWRAKTPGVVHIRVVYVVSGNNSVLSVARTGVGTEGDPYVITVNVATDGSGNPTSTANQVKLAAEGVSNVNDMVKIIPTGSDALGVVTAVASTPLAFDRYIEIMSADDLLDLGLSDSSPEYRKAQAFFTQSNAPSSIAVILLTTWANGPTEIAAIRNQGFDAWYKCVLTTTAKGEAQGVSDYLASIKKRTWIYTDDITALVGRNNSREMIILSNEIANHSDARLLGHVLAKQIGSFNYAYQRPDGIANSKFTNAQTNSIINDRGNLIANFKSFDVFWNGKTTSGVWEDIMDIRDWLDANLNADLASVFLNNDIVPFSIAGLNLMETAMRQRFDQAGRLGIIAAVETEGDLKRSDNGAYQYIIDFPESIDEIPDNDRNNAHMPGLKWKARLRGKTNTVDVTGTVE